MTARIQDIARAARRASVKVADLPGAVRNAVLLDLAERIGACQPEILAANAQDLAAAESAGVDAPKRKRLRLTPESLAQMREGLRQVAALPDPVGQVTKSYTVPSGLQVEKVRTPLGVIAMIYEARPGVTVDAFALCFKAGNACLLKGGREADRSNRVLAGLIRVSLAAAGAPEDAMAALTSSDREELRTMLTLSDDIDLVIPRGGEALIRFVHEHARIPTIQHFKGVCHVFVDRAADLDKALAIVATGKTSSPATCNTTECVLIHADVAPAFVPRLVERAASDGVTIRADERFAALAGAAAHVEPATDGDWGTEYLDLILAARVVEDFEAALAHIHHHTSNHTEAIVTEDRPTADAFCRRVRSSCVLVNASTRFNDGFQLGLGAEIGISTSRIHAYGPMGLEGLTIERFVVMGDGQTR
jgi:glutamate-5-semialdehyde dehydrogenase